MVGKFLACAVLTMALGISSVYAQPKPTPTPALASTTAPSDIVKHGEYLATLGDCSGCHTAKGGTPFAGGQKMDTPFGPIYPPNITPDKQTGIGAWTDDQFYRALHEGIGHDGKYLYPVFPFPWYTNVTRPDVLAIKAYLFSLKPVHAENKPPAFSFPFDIRDSLATWRLLFFKAGKPQAPRADDPVGRGRYIVEGLGHCGECHNHNNLFGASDWSGKFEGGVIEGWYAPNITPDGRQGVGKWSDDEIVKFLKTGAAPGHGVVLGPMKEVIHDSLSHVSDSDLHAIAAYLKSVKPKETFANNEGGLAHKGAPGANLYLSHCSSCHGVQGEGEKGRVPALAENGAVKAGGPEDVLRVVLGGLTPAHGRGPMPAVGASLSDADVAQIANYVRNNFGNAAPTMSKTSFIDTLRKETPTVMAPVKPSDCTHIDDAPIMAQVNDGAIGKIVNGAPVNRLPAIDALLNTLQPNNGKVSDATVTDLTAAYCTASFKGKYATVAERARVIGDLAVLTYSRARAR